MNFISKLLNKKPTKLHLQFGRYSNVVNSPKRHSYWDYSFKMFEAKKYQDSYKSLLLYLENSKGDNIKLDIISKYRFNFDIIQGSKMINGKVNEDGIFLEVKIAKITAPEFGLFTNLLEENYYRHYTKYALDSDSNICLVFQSEHANASPLKIYYALREMAVSADKNDDFWIDQYASIVHSHSEHTLEASAYEKREKFLFFKKKYDELDIFIANNREFLQAYPGAHAYMMLDFVFTMDYLLKPEGTLMRIFEDMYKSFINTSFQNPADKMGVIYSYFLSIAHLDQNAFYKEIYPTIYTFGIPDFINHQRVEEIIKSETQNMAWYFANGKEEIVVSIGRYIVGYLMYNFSLPTLDREMLHLYLKVMEHSFFTLFEPDISFVKKNKINKKSILNEVSQIIKRHKEIYKEIVFDLDSVDFKNLAVFSQSYLTAVAAMSFSKELSL